MRTIAVMNAKGGTGKSSLTVNTAAALAEAGRKVLVVDLDPQASASSWLGVSDGGRGLLDALISNVSLSDLVAPSTAPGVDLVASSLWLAGAEKALAGEPGAETLFRSALGKLPARWDYLLVDSAPALGFMSVSAMTACSELLVPVEATPMALAGVASLLPAVDKVRERLNPRLRVTGIVLFRTVARQRISQEVAASLERSFPDLVFRATIRENARSKEAHSHARPVPLYDPQGAGAEDYRAIAKELELRGKQRQQGKKRLRCKAWLPRQPRSLPRARRGWGPTRSTCWSRRRAGRLPLRPRRPPLRPWFLRRSRSLPPPPRSPPRPTARPRAGGRRASSGRPFTCRRSSSSRPAMRSSLSQGRRCA